MGDENRPALHQDDQADDAPAAGKADEITHRIGREPILAGILPTWRRDGDCPNAPIPMPIEARSAEGTTKGSLENKGGASMNDSGSITVSASRVDQLRGLYCVIRPNTRRRPRFKPAAPGFVEVGEPAPRTVSAAPRDRVEGGWRTGSRRAKRQITRQSPAWRRACAAALLEAERSSGPTICEKGDASDQDGERCRRIKAQSASRELPPTHAGMTSAGRKAKPRLPQTPFQPHLAAELVGKETIRRFCRRVIDRGEKDGRRQPARAELQRRSARRDTESSEGRGRQRRSQSCGRRLQRARSKPVNRSGAESDENPGGWR